MERTSGSSGSSLPAAYFSTTTSSFAEFLRMQAPDLLPGRSSAGAPSREVDAPHGTTIVAVTFAGGVLIAGDRRATSGNLIASRDMEKVHVTDDYSAVGIAGTAGIALELVRLYTVELAHYEKIEGVPLSLDGKTNKLAGMVKGNLDAAMAGLAVLPLFVGYDTEAEDPKRAGRIVSYDVTGGRYEERAGYHAIGSGSLFAKSSLKKLYDPDADAEAAVRTAVEALYDAADDDTATGGPDLVRRIFPTVITITGEHGAVPLPEEQASAVAQAVVTGRAERAARGRS
ncbi:proteasome subunit beta [Amycolatopsis rhizosphaerae]|uniref:Proteasome subunit beta n=1 Tax=Amycolatopsis rhizosphaerae TaxID=2053003 RepID=A0A558AWM4_9PSEU|nr:proteasome subunit beta [Amycolatopsis rhizosphaerae]TVT28666.1 proteasome subunit beta [Amycolatopsis rhizosphaerae]